MWTTPPPAFWPTTATAENNRISHIGAGDAQSKSSNFSPAKAAHIVEMMIAFRHILCYSKGREMGAADDCRRFLKPTMNTHMEVNTNGKIAAAV